MIQHPKVYSLDRIETRSGHSAAEYLREMATLIDQHEEFGITHVEHIVVEMSSAKDSPVACVTVNMVLRNIEGQQ